MRVGQQAAMRVDLTLKGPGRAMTRALRFLFVLRMVLRTESDLRPRLPILKWAWLLTPPLESSQEVKFLR